MRSPVRHRVGIIAAGTALGLAAIGPAGAATAPAPAAGPARPVTAYVVNSGDGTVTPISTATNRPGRAIRILPAGDDRLSLFAIEITPDGRTAYVLANGAPGSAGSPAGPWPPRADAAGAQGHRDVGWAARRNR